MFKDDLSVQDKKREEKSPREGSGAQLKAQEWRLGSLSIDTHSELF